MCVIMFIKLLLSEIVLSSNRIVEESGLRPEYTERDRVIQGCKMINGWDGM